MKSCQRIVVTGMGLVTPLGCGVEANWSRLLAGKSGIGHLDESVTRDLPVKIAGVVPGYQEDTYGLNPDLVISPKEQKRIDRFILFALAAAQEALEMAAWSGLTPEESERTATVVASGVGGLPAIVKAVRVCDEKGPRRLSPFVIPSLLANLAASHIAIKHKFTGPLSTPVAACAAGVQAIGDAARLIRAGEAEIAVCGGSEACIDVTSLGSFNSARALSTGFNDNPERASRPFDADRDGFVMAEGAGVLVIETLEHARARGAKPIAELLGYGTTSDAFHVTSGPEDGNQAARAMQLALNTAGLRSSEIQHVNAHATSTPWGDKAEAAAIKSVFGTQCGLAISATKSATGHLLGAAGSVESIFTILALRDQIAPATLNLDNVDPAAIGLDIVRNSPREMLIENALSNGFGFGGVNASVLFGKYRDG